MRGASAYCGGLYLAALAAMADMSDRAGLEHQVSGGRGGGYIKNENLHFYLVISLF